MIDDQGQEYYVHGSVIITSHHRVLHLIKKFCLMLKNMELPVFTTFIPDFKSFDYCELKQPTVCLCYSIIFTKFLLILLFQLVPSTAWPYIFFWLDCLSSVRSSLLQSLCTGYFLDIGYNNDNNDNSERKQQQMCLCSWFRQTEVQCLTPSLRVVLGTLFLIWTLRQRKDRCSNHSLWMCQPGRWQQLHVMHT